MGTQGSHRTVAVPDEVSDAAAVDTDTILRSAGGSGGRGSAWS